MRHCLLIIHASAAPGPPPRSGASEDVAQLDPGAFEASAGGRRQAAPAAVDEVVEHRHGGLEPGAARATAGEHGTLEPEGDAARGAGEEPARDVHGVGGLRDVPDPRRSALHHSDESGTERVVIASLTITSARAQDSISPEAAMKTATAGDHTYVL